MLLHPIHRPSATRAIAREHRRRLGIGTMALMAVVMSCLVSTQLRAQEAGDPAAGGALMLQRAEGAPMPAVRLGTDMDVTVSGQILRVRVTQAFRNTSNEWMEATYLYPLPDDGAVDTLKMVVGQRVIMGRIAQREEARQIYEAAKADGRKAGLVESSRPNLFRNSVANIGPGETVLVSIEYQALVRQLAGEFAMRLPLVVGPRYVPPHTMTDQAALADARQVSAPIADPSLGNSLNPVSITVHLQPGFVPANIISPYHRISVAEAGPQARTITLAAGEEPADRDFELRWRSAGADPTLGLFRQNFDGQNYVMATITPQTEVEAGRLPPREMIFVIDNSGSMHGESMAAAKESLLHALTTLRPEDRFNIIRFDDTLTSLFDHATPASAEQIALARRFTEGLEASGGTEMLPALKAALVDDHPGDKGLRQVIFLTDGDLSNEKEMMAEIATNGGRSGVFMIGLGSAPNNFLMRRMAEAGRGTYTNIGNAGEVMAKMTALLDRLKAPGMRDISVRIEGSSLQLTPARLPTLYAGEPLVLLGRGDKLEGRLIVSGMIGDRRWSQTVNLADAADSPSVARLWGSRRVADVEAQRWSREMEEDAAKAAIAGLGLAFHIVTSETSLVAVDETPSRPDGARLTQEELPLLLPKGWDFDALFGGELARLPAPAGSSEQMQELDLPQTATGFLAMLGRGFAVLLAGLAGLLTLRLRKGEVA